MEEDDKIKWYQNGFVRRFVYIILGVVVTITTGAITILPKMDTGIQKNTQAIATLSEDVSYNTEVLGDRIALEREFATKSDIQVLQESFKNDLEITKNDIKEYIKALIGGESGESINDGQR